MNYLAILHTDIYFHGVVAPLRTIYYFTLPQTRRGGHITAE